MLTKQRGWLELHQMSAMTVTCCGNNCRFPYALLTNSTESFVKLACNSKWPHPLSLHALLFYQLHRQPEPQRPAV